MRRDITYNCSHKKRNRALKRRYKAKKKNKINKVVVQYCNDIKQIKMRNKRSQLLDFISDKKINKSEKKDYDVNKRELQITIPEDFSLITNPEGVFKVINTLIFIYKNKSKLRFNAIYFNYKKNKYLELSAISLHNVICLNLRNNGISIGGNINRKWNQETINLYFYNGIYNALELDPAKFLDNIQSPHKLDLLGGGKNKPEISCRDMKLGGATSTLVKNWFDECLQYNGFKLSREGRKNIGTMLSEIFTNCSEHSGVEINQYYCSANYYHLDDNIGKVRISIFNFGQTISEGLEANNSLPPKTQEIIQNILNKNTGFLKRGKKESLLTLHSLQDRVSRLFAEDTSRGTGTVKFIQCFTKLGKSLKNEYHPKLSIISGSTQIIVTDDEISQATEKRNLPLNKEKDLHKLPSKDHVKNINSYFPGTMISLDIYLDKEFMLKAKEG